MNLGDRVILSNSLSGWQLRGRVFAIIDAGKAMPDDMTKMIFGPAATDEPGAFARVVLQRRRNFVVVPMGGNVRTHIDDGLYA